jgi:hypothetical protein
MSRLTCLRAYGASPGREKFQANSYEWQSIELRRNEKQFVPHRNTDCK